LAGGSDERVALAARRGFGLIPALGFAAFFAATAFLRAILIGGFLRAGACRFTARFTVERVAGRPVAAAFATFFPAFVPLATFRLAMASVLSEP
jgi:hypothetical protein